MSKKLNVAYGESQQAGIDALVKGGTFTPSTAHVEFDAKSVTLPEGLTEEAFQRSMAFVGDLTGQVEVGTAHFARQAFNDNNEITRVDGSLTFGGVTFHSDHDLQQKVGEDTIFGSSTTMMNHNYSTEQTAWLEESRASLSAQAAKLFD